MQFSSDSFLFFVIFDKPCAGNFLLLFHCVDIRLELVRSFVLSPSIDRSLALRYNFHFVSMDVLPSFIDSLEFIESEGHFQTSDDAEQNEEIDNLLLQHTNLNPSIDSTPSKVAPAVDLPSHRKHYGLLTFFNSRIPILFRYENSRRPAVRSIVRSVSLLALPIIFMFRTFDFPLHSMFSLNINRIESIQSLM